MLPCGHEHPYHWYLGCLHYFLTFTTGEAASAPERGDLYVIDLSIKFFNTYIRAAINKTIVHTVYIVLFQYRKLAESLIKYGKELKKDRDKYSLGVSLEDRALQIAKFMRYYSSEVTLRRLFFLAEVIAHDIRNMLELAVDLESVIHDKLLDVFMTVFDVADKSAPEGAIRGIRRAQVCLASSYLMRGKTHYAQKIFDDFAEESPGRLDQLCTTLFFN